jgi:hypothetical protein
VIRIVTASLVATVMTLASQAQQPALQFVDITRHAGIAFQHTSGVSADKHLVETMGSGGLFFDYDDDGLLDLFLVDGGSIADPAVARRARHRLYRNRGGGRFEDVTGRSGIQHREYGMGACAADYDGDGDTDLYITNDGPNVLYRNEGGGTFTDTTAAARVGDPRWSASCAFADLDRDGDLDLWVVNYVDTKERRTGIPGDRGRHQSPFCGDGRGNRFYCHPLKYEPLSSTLYRNDGGGTFTDVSTASGIAKLRSNGLGVVVSDYDGDGWPDVFVANDSMPNFLFRNARNLRFTEAGLAAGVAVAADGKARAGMGIDTGDYNGDGRLDVVITNLDFEMHSLHRGLQHGLFAYATSESGIGFPTLPFVGFGVAFLDADNDAQLDIAIANGHILENAPQYRPGSTYRQRKLLFRNLGTRDSGSGARDSGSRRRFAEIGRTTGAPFAAEKVGRGLATGDIDNDGDLDLLVTNNGETTDLLRNDGGNRGHALLVRLRGSQANTDAIGARLRVTAGAQTQIRDVKAGSSYLTQSDLRAHFGLGAATMVERIDVQWPSGKTETIRDVAANQLVTIEEGAGIINRMPLSR